MLKDEIHILKTIKHEWTASNNKKPKDIVFPEVIYDISDENNELQGYISKHLGPSLFEYHYE